VPDGGRTVSKRLVKLATAICAVVSLSVGCAWAESSWQLFTTEIPGGGSFSVKVPQPPKYQSTQDATGNIRYNVHVWSVELGADRAYLVSVAVYPVDIGAANTRRLLEGVVATRTSSGQWANVEWKQHQGLPAFDAVGKARGGRDIRVFGVMKATRLFVLTCTGLEGSARSDDANRFISSLTIR
jgi:hypothetical protein